MIDSIANPVFKATAANKAAKTTSADYSVSTPTQNVSYFFVDMLVPAKQKLDLIADFKASFPNLFSSVSYALHVVKFAIKPAAGFELDPTIQNSYNAGITNAKEVDLSSLIKVIDTVAVPRLEGDAAS